MGVNDSQNEQPSASQVESVDPSEQSIDEQLVQLAQAKLDGKIDQETHERLVGLLKELQAPGDWKPSKSIGYATPSPGPSTVSQIWTVLIIVFLIFALIALLLPMLSRAKRLNAKVAHSGDSSIRVDISNLERALDAFEIDNDRYPTSAEGLASLLQSPAKLTSSWHGPYVKSVPPDPWGRAYLYRSPGNHHPNSYDLSSAGADGVAETADDIANWEVQAR